MLIAHRGGRRYAPENTLAAFRHALSAGADGIECDIQLSRDGEIVIIHDETLERTTNGHGPVAGLTLAELQALDAGGGEPVPSLRQMLDLTRASGCRLLIELKSPALYPGIEQKVLDLLRETGDLARSAILSFDHGSLQTVRRLDAGVHLCALVGGWRMEWEQLPSSLQSIGPMVEAVLVNPRLVPQAHARGLQVFAWFNYVEYPVMYRPLRARGADSLTGDDTLAMIKTLRR